MVIEKTSADYIIVDSGTAIGYNGKSDITFSIETDDQFSFSVKIVFESNDEKKHLIRKSVTGNVITLVCVNFDSEIGACSADPVPLATVEGKNWYLNLWAHTIHNGAQRYIVYTIYRER